MELKLDNGVMYYDVRGEGPNIVFLHAGVGDSRMWATVVELLCKDYTCITCDLRGYGKSFLPNSPFSYARDVGDLIQEVAGGSAWVVGASFGAAVAIDTTLQTPEQIKGLILASPAVGGFKPVSEVLEFGRKEDELFESGDIAAASQLNVAMWLAGPQRRVEDMPQELCELVYDMQHLAFTHPEPEHVVFEKPSSPAIDNLAKLSTPTFIASGELDAPEFLALSHRLNGEIAGSERVQFADVAHLLVMEKPRQFSEYVGEIVGRLQTV